MGLFDETITQINDWLEGKRAAGYVRELDLAPSDWPREKSIILKADMEVELGNPLQTSLSVLIWSDGGAHSWRDEVLLIGPDLPEATPGALPLARLVMVRGDFADEYESYRELIEAAYGLDLRGVTSRSLPSRQEIWLRISHDAMREGLSLQKMGNALIEQLKQLDSVETVQVIWVTSSREDIGELRYVADRARTIVEALVKMYDEMNFDCEECEYVEVCDEVGELRMIHERLKGSN